MEYDFSQFLKDSQEQCKTKNDFIKIISDEIELVMEIPSKPTSNLDRHSYLKRLKGAEFAAKTAQFKEPDEYNDELRNLLESLS